MYTLPVHLCVCERGREEAWSIYLSVHGKEIAKIYTRMVLVFLLRLQVIFILCTSFCIFQSIFNNHITFRIWKEKYKLFLRLKKKIRCHARITQVSRAGRVCGWGRAQRGGASRMWCFKPGLPRAHRPAWPRTGTFGLRRGQMRQLGGIQSFAPPPLGWGTTA